MDVIVVFLISDPLMILSVFPPHRERPAAISIEIKSIDDTSNFDDFPESDILQPGSVSYFFAETSFGSESQYDFFFYGVTFT